MTPYATNLATCHRCPRHDGKGGCRAGGTIVAAATAGVCPLGRFPPRDSTSVGASSVVPAGLDPAAAWRLDSKGNEPCGCK